MWRNVITFLYPDAVHRTYRVPPEHFNRVPFVRGTITGTGQSALVPYVHTATSVQNVPPPSQPPGNAAPVDTIPPPSQPPGNAAPVDTVPPASQPPGNAAAVDTVPPASQQSNPRTKHSLWTKEPHPPATPGRVLEGDIRDDFCVSFVTKNLQELGESRTEAMFILSQLNFGSYLNRPCYAAAAAHLRDLPT